MDSWCCNFAECFWDGYVYLVTGMIILPTIFRVEVYVYIHNITILAVTMILHLKMFHFLYSSGRSKNHHVSQEILHFL